MRLGKFNVFLDLFGGVAGCEGSEFGAGGNGILS